MYKNIYLVSLIALISCGRTNMAPVEMKLDGDGDIIGYEDAGQVAQKKASNEDKLGKVNSDVYIVKSGETLFDIANKLNIDPMRLAQINGIEYPYSVHVGQKLRLPSATPSPETEKIILPDEKEEIEVNKTDEEAKKSEAKEKDENLKGELDAMFASIGGTSGAAATEGVAGSKSVVKEEIKGSNGNSFLEQEEQLSKPKIKSEKKAEAPRETKPAEQPKVEKQKAEVAISSWVAPTKGKIISKFGDIVDGEANDGIDIKAPLGTPVKAVSNGTVIYAGEGNGLDSGFGKAVFIDHKDGLVSSYTHLNNVSIKNGAKVKAGDVIGAVGKTGDVNEPMLHFEMTKGLDATPVNPSKYVKF